MDPSNPILLTTIPAPAPAPVTGTVTGTATVDADVSPNLSPSTTGTTPFLRACKHAYESDSSDEDSDDDVDVSPESPATQESTSTDTNSNDSTSSGKNKKKKGKNKKKAKKVRKLFSRRSTKRVVVTELMDQLSPVTKDGKVFHRFRCKKCGFVCTFKQKSGWTNPLSHLKACLKEPNLEVRLFIIYNYYFHSCILLFPIRSSNLFLRCYVLLH